MPSLTDSLILEAAGFTKDENGEYRFPEQYPFDIDSLYAAAEIAQKQTGWKVYKYDEVDDTFSRLHYCEVTDGFMLGWFWDGKKVVGVREGQVLDDLL